jgi:two-component system, NarL family, nitrate/nitrite response regulator NarL
MIKILIADDHKVLSESLRNSLSEVNNFHILGLAKNGIEAVNMTRDLKPDIILMDIHMKCMNGMDAAIKILNNDPKKKIILLTVENNRSFVIEALKIGVEGYFLKECSLNELIIAIENVSNGEKYYSPEIEKIIKDSQKDNKYNEKSVMGKMTHEERTVFQLCKDGKTIEESAEILNTGTRTIERHRQKIRELLGIDVKETIREFINKHY